MDINTLQASIKQISASATNDDIAVVAAWAASRNLQKGEVLLREGVVCRSFYLVEKGYLRTWFNKDGVEINLNFTFEGRFTSNLKSLKSKQPSEFIIEAGENCCVWIFDLEKLGGHINQNLPISVFVRRLAIRILLAAEEHSNLFKLYTPAERYHYIEKNNPMLLQRVSLSQLASYLGVTRETLSRIRAKVNS